MKNHAADLAELRALNRRFIHNFVTRDVASHDALLHARFHCITPSGARMERAAYLDYWATAFDPAVLVYWDMRDERIECFGPLALVSASNRWVRGQGSTRVDGATCYTDTYLCESGRWRCVLAQLTPVAVPGDLDGANIVVRYHRGTLDSTWPAAGP
jgi:hypothetical protein